MERVVEVAKPNLPPLSPAAAVCSLSTEGDAALSASGPWLPLVS